MNNKTIQATVINEAVPSVQDQPVIVAASSRANTSFNGGLFIFALFTVLYFAHEIVIPILLGFVLKLVLQPVIRLFQKFKIPRALTAIIIIAILMGMFIGLGTILSRPALLWAEKLPTALPKLQERLTFLSEPIGTIEHFLMRAENVTKGAGPKVVPVAIEGNRLSDKLLSGTRALIGGLLTTLLMLFFLMSAGDTFLRRLVEILPRFEDKRQAVDISQQIERDISAYLLTITIMNTCVGLATGLIMASCGIEDPILWGTLAFLLNYIPIIGPFIGISIFVLIGLLVQPTLAGALLPAGLYLLIHILEANIITPNLLARRFTLNPVLVILSLIFWFWMWGIPGAILAMPILAIIKIICARIQNLAAIGHFLEG